MYSSFAALFFGHAVAAAAPPVTPATPVRYDVTVEQSGIAHVQVCVQRERARLTFSVDRFRKGTVVSGVTRAAHALRADGTQWTAERWKADECLSYAADLGALADSHSEAGSRHAHTISSDPSYWLLEPDLPYAPAALVTVHLPPAWRMSAPWRTLSQDATTVVAMFPFTPHSWSGSVVFGQIDEHAFTLRDGSIVRLATSGGGDDANDIARPERWIRDAAQAVADVSGKFPVPEARVLVIPVSELSMAFRFAAWLQPGAVLGGESARGQGNSLELVIDPRRPEAEFLRDWTTFHELSHLMHPSLDDRGTWLGEGLATYYQTVLRVRAGRISAASGWQRMAEGYAEARDDTGGATLEEAAADMQRSHHFNYVYRAGALFWLTVDVELRRASGGKQSLDGALGAFRACCLPSYREWQPEEFVRRLDVALGVHTFTQRYDEFRVQKQFPEWHALFARLGIDTAAEKARFDDAAPDAAIRDAIMAPVAAHDRSP